MSMAALFVLVFVPGLVIVMAGGPLWAAYAFLLGLIALRCMLRWGL